MRHREKGYIINVNSKHGRMLVSRDGFVTINGKGYKGFNKVKPGVIDIKFEKEEK